jgi:hypothetical protein
MDTVINILIRSHSGLRWVVLGLLVAAIVNATMKKKSGTYTEGDRKLNLFAMVFLHIQLLIGLVLYFNYLNNVDYTVDFSEPKSRFYSLEHIFGMLLAIILATVGHSKAKRADDASRKHRTIFIAYFFALILIVASIPWPFRKLDGSWF